MNSEHEGLFNAKSKKKLEKSYGTHKLQTNTRTNERIRQNC